MSSISFSGVGSGLPIDTWIDALVSVEQTKIDNLTTTINKYNSSQTSLNSIQSKFVGLRSSLEKITDANLASVFDLFKRRTASSSDTGVATATANGTAVNQSIDLKVTNLATATVAKSTNSPGKVADGSTKVVDLSNASGKEGSFSLFVNNKKYEYDINKDTTIDNVISKINADFSTNNEITASITDGKFKIDVDNSKVTDFRMGSVTDGSNFLNVTQLSKVAIEGQSATPGQIDYAQSSNQLSSAKTDANLVGNGVNLSTAVTAGTFTIGEQEFTINDKTNFGDLIAAINSDEDAGAVASFDVRTNSFKLTSKTPGEKSINLESGTSNFLVSMGLVNGDGTLASGSQTLGKNALVEINGNTIEANSNTLGSDITGISGLTINLNKVSQDSDGNATTIKINVSQDTAELTSAIDSFIGNFNSMSSDISSKTGKSGDLYGEYSLLRLKSDLRSSATSAVSGNSAYKTLASIGISTGKPGSSITADTSSLQFDKTKFLEALNANPEEVKALLVGNSETGTTGVFQTLEAKVESAMDPEYGYFASRSDSFDSSIDRLNTQITRKEDALEAYRARLLRQFTAMDSAIAQMQSQSSTLSSYLGTSD